MNFSHNFHLVLIVFPCIKSILDIVDRLPSMSHTFQYLSVREKQTYQLLKVCVKYEIVIFGSKSTGKLQLLNQDWCRTGAIFNVGEH